jgi:hypothetical protein
LTPDDANPAEAYPAHLISGTLPPKGAQQTLQLWNRMNSLGNPVRTLFGRPKGSLSNQ